MKFRSSQLQQAIRATQWQVLLFTSIVDAGRAAIAVALVAIVLVILVVLFEDGENGTVERACRAIFSFVKIVICEYNFQQDWKEKFDANSNKVFSTSMKLIITVFHSCAYCSQWRQ